MPRYCCRDSDIFFEYRFHSNDLVNNSIHQFVIIGMVIKVQTINHMQDARCFFCVQSSPVHGEPKFRFYGVLLRKQVVKQFFVVIDVKFQFGFISYLEDNKFEADFTSNISWVQNQTSNMKIRMVISHQAIKKANEILARFKKHSISNIELLACHQLAENKYKQLGLNPSHYSAPSDDELSEFINVLSANNIYSNVLSL